MCLCTTSDNIVSPTSRSLYLAKDQVHPAWDFVRPTCDPMYPTWDPACPTWDPKFPTWDPRWETWDPAYPTQDPTYPTRDPRYFFTWVASLSPPLVQSGFLFVHLHDTFSTPFGRMEGLQNLNIGTQSVQELFCL